MPILDPYHADTARYDGRMPYRRVGRSGLVLPAISLGLWHNFGDDMPFARQRDILRRAFDLGINHFDLANNYGPPYGQAEENFARHLRNDFRPYREQLVISTKAGWDYWPGPYGDLGSRKYLIDSLDASLERMGLDHVDIFYHHRADPDTPLEETMGALDYAVRSGRARYVGVSSYSPQRTAKAVDILQALGTPLLIHQPSYSMLNRWVEGGLLAELDAQGMGCIAFTALAQDAHRQVPRRHPADSCRAGQVAVAGPAHRGQPASHRRPGGARGGSQPDPRAARDRVGAAPGDGHLALVGASSVAPARGLRTRRRQPHVLRRRLAAIDEHATEGGLNLWAGPSSI